MARFLSQSGHLINLDLVRDVIFTSTISGNNPYAPDVKPTVEFIFDEHHHIKIALPLNANIDQIREQIRGVSNG